MLITGCRVNPRAEREIALLRAEILDLEDQYYALKSRCQGADDSNSNGNVFYESTIIDENCSDCGPNTVYYDRHPNHSSAPSVIEDVESEDLNSNDFEDLEEIDQLIDDPAGLESIDSGAARGSSTRLQIVPHADERLPKKVSYPRNSGTIPADRNAVTSIVINRQISRGEDLDGKPGDEGLSLLLQPIDAQGNVRKSAGHITVRVTESRSPNVERQIGLWQFTPEEAKSFFVKDEYAQQGILLHLPWDNLTPKGNQLNVLVRFTHSNQQAIESKARIRIVPPANSYSPDAPLVAGWIERDERWVDVEIESFNENGGRPRKNSSRDVTPEFRTKTPTTQSRISAPGWRPVR